jgi:SLT domain-containing protein
VPDGFRVATGYIEVDPDMTGFADKVRAELDKEDNHVKVPLEVDTDGFAEKIRLAVDKAKLGNDVSIPLKVNESDIESMKNDFKKLSTDLHGDATNAGDSLGSAISKGLADAVASGAGGAAGDVSGAAGGGGGEGGGILGALKGTVIGGLVAWGVSLLPAVVPTVFGGFFAAAGAYIDIEGNATLKASLGRVMTTMKKEIESDASVFTPAIYSLTKGAGIALQGLQPVLKSTFADSVPYLKTFVGILEDFAFIIMPPLNQMLKEFTPYLPIMQQGFDSLAKGMGAFMHNLGPGMQSSAEIFAVSMKILGGLLAGLGYAASTLANNIMDMSHAIRISWDAVSADGKAMAHDIDTTFTTMRHDIAAIWDGISADITNIAKSLWNNTIGEFTERSSTLQQLQVTMGHNLESDWDAFTGVLKNAWSTFWRDTIGEFTSSSSSLRNDLRSWGNNLVGDWKSFDSTLTSGWNTFWRDTVGEVTSQSSSIRSTLRSWGSTLSGDWKSFESTIRNDWDSFWRNIESDASAGVSRVASVVKGIEAAFQTPINFAEHDIWDPMASVWNKVAGVLHLSTLPTYAAGGVLPGAYAGPPRDEQIVRVSGGESILNQGATAAVGPQVIGWLNSKFAYPGAKSDGTHFAAGSFNPVGAVEGAISAAGSAVSGAVTGAFDIAKFIANPLGSLNAFIKSDGSGPVAAVMTDLIKQVPEAIVKTLLSTVTGGGTSGKYTGSFGSGVAQWRPDVLAALSMLGLSSSLANQVLYQMQTESGGNPNAINLTDSNAAAGDPSRGLLQTIMTTFDAYHVAGTSNDIYNPLANIAAAINYARSVYGPTLMRGGMGMGSGHGYAMGGSPAPGEMAWVGEQGPELVQFSGGQTVYNNKKSQQIASSSQAPLVGTFNIIQQEVGTTAEVMQALTYTLKNAALTATSARSR